MINRDITSSVHSRLADEKAIILLGSPGRLVKYLVKAACPGIPAKGR